MLFTCLKDVTILENKSKIFLKIRFMENLYPYENRIPLQIQTLFLLTVKIIVFSNALVSFRVWKCSIWKWLVQRSLKVKLPFFFMLFFKFQTKRKKLSTNVHLIPCLPIIYGVVYIPPTRSTRPLHTFRPAITNTNNSKIIKLWCLWSIC